MRARWRDKSTEVKRVHSVQEREGLEDTEKGAGHLLSWNMTDASPVWVWSNTPSGLLTHDFPPIPPPVCYSRPYFLRPILPDALLPQTHNLPPPLPLGHVLPFLVNMVHFPKYSGQKPES